MKRRALISVYDKTGIFELARYLADTGWEIISTGGTAKYLVEQGLPVTDVSAVTGFPECLDGRVKTLHPAIHGGLLARREEASHMATLQSLGIEPIDLVCVNLYPFFEKVQAGLSLEQTIEFIDIGGPTMLRSAAKNYRDVIVLTDPADYPLVIDALRGNETATGQGAKGEEERKTDSFSDLRKRLAGKVFNLTSAYDAAISRYLLEDTFPSYYSLSLAKKQDLRYGENGHQTAALYLHTDSPGALGAMEQLHGKELSYNNIRDLDLAWKTVSAFGFPLWGVKALGAKEARNLLGTGAEGTMGAEPVCCVAVKHNTPCGVALGSNLLEAYTRAYACDPVSIFGGIVACNTEVDEATAEKLGELFLEIIVAPQFSPQALEILKKKKNLRLLRASLPPTGTMEYTSIDGGLLVQTADRRLLDTWEVVTQTVPPAEDVDDLLFGLRVVTYVKSNAIVVVKHRTAIGIAGGQTNRIWSAEQALERARLNIANSKELSALNDGKPARVLASDAFFPFPDVVETAGRSGIRSIIQPGGSIRDRESIEACDRYGIAMVFTGIRHFKH